MILSRVKRPWLWAALAGLVCTLAVLLIPYPKNPSKIQVDQEAIARKNAFLQGLTRGGDSLPNVVIILADDLGRSDISLYGNQLIKTPNIDSIGLMGATYNEGYITSPICSPSRAGLLTGRYQQRFGFEYIVHDRYARNRLEWLVYKHFLGTSTWQALGQPAVPSFQDIAAQGLPLEQITLAELLKARGYATAAMGKWHLGHAEHLLPHNRGFDTHFGFYEGYSLYMADTADQGIVNQRHDREYDFSDPFIWGAGRDGNCAIRLNGHLVDEQFYLTNRLAEESVKFIGKNAKQPFFLYVPFLTPHTPFQATRKYYDRLSHITDRNKRVYMAMIAQMDDAVGTIVEALRSNGVLGNTLIFFLSDNGGATYTLATENEPFKGGKFTHFEGGLRVPFMMRFDGRIAPGITVNEPVSSLDVFATIAQLINTQMPTEHGLDGRSLLTPSTEPRNLFWRSGYAWAVRSGPWKLVAEDAVADVIPAKMRLYNLVIDPGETTDLSAIRPQTVDSLRNLHQQWQGPMKQPNWPTVMNFRYLGKDGDQSWFPL